MTASEIPARVRLAIYPNQFQIPPKLHDYKTVGSVKKPACFKMYQSLMFQTSFTIFNTIAGMP